ncbi:hypothetical protein PM082_024315 [Marasmius tenuissimus]|nr:hypothetical protein PM082_024315 [Marasmius tenuissimus]
MSRRSTRLAERDTRQINTTTPAIHSARSRATRRKTSIQRGVTMKSSETAENNTDSMQRRGKRAIEEQAEVPQSSRKRRKKGADNADPEGFKRIRGKRGVLERMVKDMPLDVILEVSKSLEPLDILHLARTSRALRELLMKRSSIPIWRSSRENVLGLPPLPDDLNEAQYAALAFDSVCQVCLRGACENVAWDLRMRFHATCASRILYTTEELPQLRNWSQDVSVMMRSLVHGRTYQTIIPSWVDPSGHALNGRRGFLPTIIKQYRLEYMPVKDDFDKWMDWKASKLKEHSKRLNFRKACGVWHSKLLNFQETVRCQIRQKRKQEINDRLVELGWERQDIGVVAIQTHPLVQQTRPLTARSMFLCGMRDKSFTLGASGRVNIQGPCHALIAN